MSTTRDTSIGDDLDYAFKLEVPDAFVELPNVDSPSGEDWAPALETLMPGATDNQRAMAAEKVHGMIPVLLSHDTVSASLCVGVEDDSLTLGMLTVSVQRSPHESALVAAEGIYQAKHRTLFKNEIQVPEVDYELGKGAHGSQDILLATRLPCGPAVTAISLRSLNVKQPEGDGPRAAIGIASLQLIVPAPRAYCVYATIATPTVMHLDAYSERLAHLGRTLTFDMR